MWPTLWVILLTNWTVIVTYTLSHSFNCHSSFQSYKELTGTAWSLTYFVSFYLITVLLLLNLVSFIYYCSIFFPTMLPICFFKINKLHKYLVWSEPTIGEGGAIWAKAYWPFHVLQKQNACHLIVLQFMGQSNFVSWIRCWRNRFSVID